MYAIQRLIRSKQSVGDDDAVCALQESLRRKQSRLASLPLLDRSCASHASVSNAAADKADRANFFSLFILCNGGDCDVSADAAAWRAFWDSVHVHFSVDIVLGGASDAAGCGAGVTIQSAMSQLLQAMQRSQAHRKFLFVFICCPITVSQPMSLRLPNGESLTLDYLHGWLGSLCAHDCLLVFDTGGNAFAQTALDVSRINNFSGSIISGNLGRVLCSERCSKSLSIRLGIGSELGVLSFAIIEALLSASSSLTCSQVRRPFHSLALQAFVVVEFANTFNSCLRLCS